MDEADKKDVKKTKILFLTQFYPPEVGAPQNRLHELAVRLNKHHCSVDVLTALPHYPDMKLNEQYKNGQLRRETIDGVQVFRSWIYIPHSKRFALRLLNYFSFVFTSLIVGLSKTSKDYDFILVESPPLFLGISGWLLAKIKRAKLIFNVSDLWPESAVKLGLVSNPLIIKATHVLEEWLYRSSTLITCQTQGIVENISERVSNECYWLPNGVDLQLYDPNEACRDWREKQGLGGAFIILYAGIHGYAQGLEVILSAARKLQPKYGDVVFVFVGSGPVKEELIAASGDLQNVRFVDLVPKEEMRSIISASDVAVVPLRKLDLFKGAIPSKIFESLAMAKPVLLGVDGEARALFVDQGQCAKYFEPENSDELARAVEALYLDRDQLQMLGEKGRAYVMARFNRDTIASALAAKLTATVSGEQV